MMPLDAQAGVTRQNTSRLGLCSAIVSAARGNDLPVPFFANLIWQESNFRLGEISNAGALGVAQLFRDRARARPDQSVRADPRDLCFGETAAPADRAVPQSRFAAAAYNAGPGRVNDWLVRHRALPGETRAYVHIITGHTAARWASTEFKHDFERTVMPAKAPCPEVAEEVAVRTQQARVAKLMKELAVAAAPPPKPVVAPQKPVVPPVDAMAKADDKAAKPHGMKDQSKPQTEPTVLELALARAAAGATTGSGPAVASAPQPRQVRQAKAQTQAKTTARRPSRRHRPRPRRKCRPSQPRRPGQGRDTGTQRQAPHHHRARGRPASQPR